MSARNSTRLSALMPRAARAVQEADDAGAADALVHLVEAALAQPLGDNLGGAMGFVEQFRDAGAGHAAIA